MMPGGVKTRCTSLTLPHQRCILSSASQGMGSLLGEAQVEEGPRGESGPAQDAGCLDLSGSGIKSVPLALARQIPIHCTTGEVQTVRFKWMDFISTKSILKNQKKKQ